MKSPHGSRRRKERLETLTHSVECRHLSRSKLHPKPALPLVVSEGGEQARKGMKPL